MPKVDFDPGFRNGGGDPQLPRIPHGEDTFIGPRIESLPAHDRLFIQAKGDASLAYQIYRDPRMDSFYDSYPEEQANFAMDVARAFRAVGFDTSPLLRDIDEGIENPSRHKEHGYAGKALFLAEMGDFEGTFDSVTKSTERPIDRRPIHTLVHITRVTDDPAIARHALDMVSDQIADSHYLAMLAEGAHKHGFPTDELLRRSEEAVVRDEGKRGYWYLPLAEAHAEVGNYDKAVALVPHINYDHPSERSSTYQSGALRAIAWKQAERGLFQDAFKTADMDKQPYSRAASMVDTMVKMAEVEPIPSSVIANAVAVVELVEQNTDVTKAEPWSGLPYANWIADNYAGLAVVQAKNGLDSSPLFERALDTARRVKYKLPDALRTIGRYQAEAGVDASETFNEALSIITEGGMFPDDVDQILELEVLGKAVVDTGYDEFANQILDHYASNPEHELDYTREKIELITYRAIARAKRAVNNDHK